MDKMLFIHMHFFLFYLLSLISCTPQTVQFTYELQALTSEDEKMPIPVIETGGHTGSICDISFTSDGRFLVTASEDKTVRVWDIETGESARVIRGKIRNGYEGSILAASFAPTTGLLAVGGYMSTFTGDNSVDLGAIRIFDIKNGELQCLLKKEQGPVMALAFSAGGKKLLAFQPGMWSSLWDVAERKVDFKILNSEAPALSSVEMTKRIVDGKATYWESRDVGSTVAISPDEDIAVIGYSNTSFLKLWWLKRRAPYVYDSFKYRKVLSGHNGGVHAAKFTPSGKYLLTGSGNGVINLWNGSDGSIIRPLVKQVKPVANLSITPDSRKIIAGCGAACNIYEISNGNKIASFQEHKNNVTATAVSPDGNTVASCGAGNQEIYLWDLATQKVRHHFEGRGNTIWDVGFSKDGRSIAWGKTEHGKEMFNFHHLEKSFRLKSDDGVFKLAMDEKLPNNISYLRAIESVGSLKVRTATRRPHRILQIINNQHVIHNISRDRSNGFIHNCMTLTHDGETLISGGAGGFLISYNTKTGTKLHDFTGHTSDVWDVAVSPDNRLLVSGSADQTIRLWNIATAELLLTIFQGSDSEWVAWTPEGYYISSPLGDKYIGWQMNNGEDKAADYYSAFQFERVLYRPDYVNAYLEQMGRSGNAASIRKGASFDINRLRTIAPPKIEIVSPSYGDILENSTDVPLRLSVKSDGPKMLNYTVFVNNIPITESADRELTPDQQHFFEKNIAIPLFDIRNKIRVEVLTAESMGLSETTVFSKSPVHGHIKGDLYCLSIGVDHFENMPENNLSYAAADANALDIAFRSMSEKLFSKVFTKTLSDLSNEKPTRTNIIKSLNFLKKAKAQDTVIVFLASHGLSDAAGNYYFFPTDAVMDDARMLMNSGTNRGAGFTPTPASLIRWEYFFDALRSVPGKRLLIVDTCQAKSIYGEIDIHSLAKRSASSSFALIASSKGTEESQEYPEGKHGLFTYALLKGLSGQGDRNKDGSIGLVELYQFIIQFVESKRNRSLGKQTPQLIVPAELTDMVLAEK